MPDHPEQDTIAPRFLPAAAGIAGAAPMVAGSTTLITALFMSAAWWMTLVLSAWTVAILRPLIPLEARFAFIFLVTATWVILIRTAMQAFAFPVAEALDIYLPLLAVNCVLLAELEQRVLSSESKWPAPALLRTGTGIAVLVIVAGALRELASAGTLLSDLATLLPGADVHSAFLPLRFPVFASPAGALLVFALVAALVNRLSGRS